MSVVAAPVNAQAIAREIEGAQREARQVEPFTSRVAGFDLNAGYEVARLVHEARLAGGAKAVGRKVGFTNAALWDVYGVREPIWGFVYDDTLAHVAATGAKYSLASLLEPKIEPEVAIHFRSAPAAGADLAAILACVDWIAPAFEIVQTHFPGWKFLAPDTVADNGLHGRLLLGEPVAVDALGADPIAALASFSLDLVRDGKTVASGKGSNVLGNPLVAIAHLCAVLQKQPRFDPVRAGDVVTTGTLTTAEVVKPGETWRTKVRGVALGELEVTFT